MATSHADYCTVSDVLTRMYSGVGAASYGSDANRDAFITGLIHNCSRRWEQLTGRPLNAYVPTYGPRLFHGEGKQWLDVDDFAVLYKVQYDTTQGAVPTWTDVTTDFRQVGVTPWNGGGRVLPDKEWPKKRLWRNSGFIVDAYDNGNIKVYALWGTVQPDLSADAPTGNSGHYFPPYNLVDTDITALQPQDVDGTNLGGWWVTPEDVVDVIARWVLYLYKSSQAAYSDQAGSPSTSQASFGKSVPQFVQDLVTVYTDEDFHIAMITPDGVDLSMARVYGNIQGSPGAVSRWAGWQTK